MRIGTNGGSEMTSNDLNLIIDMIEGRAAIEGETFYKISKVQGRAYKAEEVVEGFLLPEVAPHNLREYVNARLFGADEVFVVVRRSDNDAICYFLEDRNEAMGLALTRRCPWVARLPKKDRLVINPIDRHETGVTESDVV